MLSARISLHIFIHEEQKIRFIPHTSKGEFSENFLKLFLDELISAEKAAETLDMTVEQFLAKAKVQMS